MSTYWQGKCKDPCISLGPQFRFRRNTTQLLDTFAVSYINKVGDQWTCLQQLHSEEFNSTLQSNLAEQSDDCICLIVCYIQIPHSHCDFFIGYMTHSQCPPRFQGESRLLSLQFTAVKSLPPNSGFHKIELQPICEF